MPNLPTVDNLRRLLLLEADPGDALLLSAHIRMATGERAQVQQASTLEEGLAYLRAESFDAVLSDVALPDARGEEVIRGLMAEAPDVALVVVTSEADQAQASEALGLGAQDHICKETASPRMLARVLRYALERKRFQRRLTHLSQFDQLTGLANVRHLRARLNQTVARADRQRQPFSLLLIGLDDFKSIKRAHGYATADGVLEEVGRRLHRAVREYDVPARLDADEFALLLEAPTSAAAADTVCARVRNLLQDSVQVGPRALRLSATLGAAHFPDDGTTSERLLRVAAERVAQNQTTRRAALTSTDSRAS